MLENDPPEGTAVRFTKRVQKGIRTLEAYTQARLKRRGGHRVDRPEDLFDVEYQGETFTVRRDEIEKA